MRPGKPAPTQARKRTVAVRATLTPEVLEVEPGATATCKVRIRNQGSIVDQYRVEILGPAVAWAACEPQMVNVYPDKEGIATIRFSPPRGPEPGAGPVSFEVRVSSTQDSSVSVIEHGTVEVAGFHQLSGELVPATVEARRKALMDVSFVNRGNEAVRVAVGARDPDRRLRIVAEPASLMCEPGSTVGASLALRATKWLWRGSSRRHPFTVTATYADDPLEPTAFEAQGAFQQHPVFSGWVRKAIAAMAIVTAIAGLAFGANRLFGGGEADVPNLVGRTLDAAEAAILAAGFTLGTVEASESAEPEGVVLSQRPPPGSSEKSGAPIHLVVAVAIGGDDVLVPDLRGENRIGAEAVLRDHGLVLGRVREQESEQPEGTVVSQDPRSGLVVAEGTLVDITVATPVISQPDLVRVPAVEGHHFADAEHFLEQEGLHVASLTHELSAAPPGTVLRHDPGPGAEVERGTGVHVVIAFEGDAISEGIEILHGTFSFDFDAGLESPHGPEPDVFWEQQTQNQRRLAPRGQAVIANLGFVDFDDIGLVHLMDRSYSSDPVDGSDFNDEMPEGTVLAIRTNSGNFAKVLIIERDVADPDRQSIHNFRFAWVTYSP